MSSLSVSGDVGREIWKSDMGEVGVFLLLNNLNTSATCVSNATILLLSADSSSLSSVRSSRSEAWSVCSGIVGIGGIGGAFPSGWTGLRSTGVRAPPSSSRRSLLVMPLSQESVFFNPPGSEVFPELLRSGRVSIDSALETFPQLSGFTMLSLNLAHPRARGSDVRGMFGAGALSLAWSNGPRVRVLLRWDGIGVAGLSVTVTMLVVATTSWLMTSWWIWPFSRSGSSGLGSTATRRASFCWRNRWNRRRTGWSGGRFRGASFFLLSLSSSSRFTSLIFLNTSCKDTELV